MRKKKYSREREFQTQFLIEIWAIIKNYSLFSSLPYLSIPNRNILNIINSLIEYFLFSFLFPVKCNIINCIFRSSIIFLTTRISLALCSPTSYRDYNSHCLQQKLILTQTRIANKWSYEALNWQNKISLSISRKSPISVF